MTTTAVPKKPAIPKAMIQSGLRRSLTTGVVGESVELDGAWSACIEFIVLLSSAGRRRVLRDEPLSF
jgi:hypothetical protein